MSKRKKRDGIYKQKKSKFWWASFKNSSGERVRKPTGTTSRKEAIALRNKWVSEVWSNEVHGVSEERTFAQVIATYLRDTAEDKRSSSTDRKKAKQLCRFFKQNLIMNNLPVEVVNDYIHFRKEDGVLNKTINKELSLLSTAIKHCNLKYEWNLKNAVIGQRLKEEDKEARVLTTQEYQRLVTSANQAHSSHTREYLPDFIVFMFNTMMRPGEVLELTWERVSFKKRTIRLRVEDTKGRAVRNVPLNEEAFSALLRLRRRADEHFPNTPWVFTHTKPRYFGKRIKSVYKVMSTAVQRAGLVHASPHALRHSSVTEATNAPNSNVVDIAKVAGHKNLKTTMNYIHVADERAHKAVANLPKVKKLVTF